MCLLCRQEVSGQLVQCVSVVPAGDVRSVSTVCVCCAGRGCQVSQYSTCLLCRQGVSGQLVQYVSAVPAGGVRSVSIVCVCCAGRGC